MIKELTYRHLEFCRHYANTHHLLKAAARAKVSEPTAKKWLKDASIQHEIKRIMHRKLKRIEVSEDKVVQEIANLAFADVSDFVDIDREGNLRLKMLGELDENQKKAIARFREIKGGGYRYVLHDKIAALNLLAKCLGLTTKLKVSGDSDEPLVITVREIDN